MSKNSQRAPKGDGSVYFDKSRELWVGKITLRREDGTTKTAKVYGHTRDEAVVRKARMKDVYDSGKPIDSDNFAHLAEAWLTHHNTGDSTKEMYRWVLDKHLLPLFGHRDIGDLRYRDVEAFLDARVHLAKSTLTKMKSCLSQIFEYARKHDHTIVNYAKIADLPSGAEAGAESHHFTKDDGVLFIKAARDERLYPWFRIAIETGGRPSEISALRERDINYAEGYVQLNNNKKRRAGQPHHQVKPRRVKVSRVTLDAIAEMKLINDGERQIAERAGKPWPVTDLVFVSNEGKPLTRWHINVIMARVASAAGLSHLGWTPTSYTLRHTAATNFANKPQMSQKEVADIMGHTDARTTRKYYHHNDAVVGSDEDDWA